MRFAFGLMEVEILDSGNQSMTEVQNQTLELLKTLKPGRYKTRQIVELLGLKSPAPLLSRLQHLEQKGYVKLKTVQPVTA
jgi:DNA-binding HxlR family transcriptional regulator